MTNEEFIAQLRKDAAYWSDTDPYQAGRYREAADRIEALTAENEQLRDRLAALDQQAETLGGCGDANCVIHRPKGQHTNGGCHCYENRAKMRVWTRQVAYFRSKVRAALEKQP